MKSLSFPDDPFSEAQRYFYWSEREKEATTKKNSSRDTLKDFIKEEGVPDENGNIIWYFDKTLYTNSGSYKGLMLQRRVSEYTDEDIAREVILDAGLEQRCIYKKVTEVLDLDEVYACNQEGLLSDDEIDSMIVISESFALVKVEE